MLLHPPFCDCCVCIHALPPRYARSRAFPLVLVSFRMYPNTRPKLSRSHPSHIETIYRYFSRSFFFAMDAYDNSLSQSIHHAVSASNPLTAMLVQRWDGHFTPDDFNEATVALGELWNKEGAGICDALRWGARWGHIQSISFVEANLIA